ncbi:MAG: glycosyltransferase family 4 protein [Candidatus Omnitrophica bacterium]|nr:glycosyltransferase family 4 protein [Candidatus Omnitrophota bacterium]
MKILFLSQYFPPEMGAPSARVSELCRYWAEKGEEVTIVTAFPNHPTGRIFPGYEGQWFQREETDGCTVLRSWIYVTPNRGFFKRVICFLSFMVSSIWTSLFKAGKCDLVIATSPQIFCGLAGWVVSCLKRTPFVLEIRDLWPDSAIQLGVIKNPLLISLSRWLERFLYHRADLIVPVSGSIQEAIEDQGIPEKRFELIPNGIDFNLFVPGERDNELRKSLDIGDRFLVSYIGTHGMAHALERLVDTAKMMDPERFHFLFIGEGARKQPVVDHAKEIGAENITFLPYQPKADIPKWLAASDLSTVSLKDIPVFETVLPSKMFEIMACERPILLLAKGECAELVRTSDAGVVVEEGDPEKIAAAIEKLAVDPQGCREYGRKGREFVFEHYHRERLAQRYLDRLKRRVTGP